MKSILAAIAIVALAPVLVALPAEAGVFSVGAAFNVGGFYFDLGFGGPRYSAHASHYVYRVSEPFHYREYQCHTGCYRDGGYTYHHADCPAVAYHFRTNGFDPHSSYPSFFASYGYDGYGGYYRNHDHRGYGSHSAYGRYDGYRNHGDYGGHYGSRYDHHRYDRYGYRDRGSRSYRSHGYRGHEQGHRNDRRYYQRRGYRDRYEGAHHSSRDWRQDRSRHETREQPRGGYRDRDSRRRDAGSTRSREGRSRQLERDHDRGRRR